MAGSCFVKVKYGEEMFNKVMCGSVIVTFGTEWCSTVMFGAVQFC